MPTYIVLGNFTEQGIENVRDAPERFEKVEELKRSLGGELKGIYPTLGQYDFVAVSEMPDDVSAAQVNLTSAMAGNVRTETLKAFSREEFREVLDGLPDQT